MSADNEIAIKGTVVLCHRIDFDYDDRYASTVEIRLKFLGEASYRNTVWIHDIHLLEDADKMFNSFIEAVGHSREFRAVELDKVELRSYFDDRVAELMQFISESKVSKTISALTG